MKSLFNVFALALAFISTPAFADWTVNIPYLEVIFNCNGTTADLSKVAAANVQLANRGEYRLPSGAVSILGTAIFLSGKGGAIRMGTLERIPQCIVEDSGEAAHPQWLKVNLDQNILIQMSQTIDSSSCQYDPRSHEYTRINHFSLIANPNFGIPVVMHEWSEEGQYHSALLCKTQEF